MRFARPLHIRKATKQPRRQGFTGRVLSAGVVLAAVSLIFAASAPANSSGRDNARTIHLHTVLVSSTVNSAGNGGPGDVVANLFSVTTSSGLTGHADISCTNFPNGEQLCHAAFVLPNGQIDAQAAIPFTARTFDAAVIGGTGAYEGASGQIVNVRSAPGVVDRVIHLLPRPKVG